MSSLNLEIQFDQDFLSTFKGATLKVIQKHASEGRFKNIISFRDKKHIMPYIKNISEYIESQLAIPSIGYIETNAIKYAEEIFYQNTVNFTVGIFNKWENKLTLRALQNSFTNNSLEYQKEINSLFKKDLRIIKEEAEYFLEIQKVSWIDTIGQFDKSSKLSFSLEYIFKFKGIHIHTGETIENLDAEKNLKAYIYIQEKLLRTLMLKKIQIYKK